MLEIEKFREDLGLIVEAGMMAIKQGDEESAKKLFNAVEIFDPKGSMKEMGYGLIAIHKLDIPTAQKHFGKVLKDEPENARAFAFMAFTHMLAVMDEADNAKKLEHLKQGAEFADKAVKMTDDPSTKKLAQSVLDWEHELQDLELQ